MTKESITIPSSVSSRLWAQLGFVALLVYGGLFLYLAVRHVLYPGFTEPMEGDALQHIERATRGLPMYPQPNGEFIPLTYLPFYYFAAVPFYQIFGDSLTGPRLLSAVSALLAGVLLWRMVRAESQDTHAAHLSAALYFSCYRIMDAYLTCALPDSFMLFWLLLGWYFLGYGRHWGHDLLWLLSFAAAFWTKQQGALYFALAVVYAIFLRPLPNPGETRLPSWAIVAGLLFAGPLVYWGVGPLLGERFVYHTLTVPARWDKSLLTAALRTTFMVFCYAPFLGLLAAFYLWPLRDLTPARVFLRFRNPLAYFTLTALVSAFFTMSSTGSSNNHYIPFLAGLSACAALGARRLLTDGVPAWTKRVLALICVFATLLVALALGLFDSHNVPLFLMGAFLAIWLAYARAMRHQWSLLGQRELALGTLIAGHLIVAFYFVPNYLPGLGYRAELSALREEVGKLDGPVIWVPYGNVPQALTVRKLERAPSWVALEDIERQEAPISETANDILPFRDRLRGMEKLYVLADDQLEDIPGWRGVAHDFELVQNFGEKFAGVRQIAIHWYGGGNYPRYLYRLRPRTSPDERAKR